MSRMAVQACPAIKWFADLEGYTLTDDEAYSLETVSLVPAASGRGVFRMPTSGGKYSPKYTGNVMGVRIEATTTGGTLVVKGDLYGMIGGQWFFVRAINSGNNISLANNPKAVVAFGTGHKALYVETWTDMGAAHEAYTFLPTDLTGTALDMNSWIGFQID